MKDKFVELDRFFLHGPIGGALDIFYSFNVMDLSILSGTHSWGWMGECGKIPRCSEFGSPRDSIGEFGIWIDFAYNFASNVIEWLNDSK